MSEVLQRWRLQQESICSDPEGKMETKVVISTMTTTSTFTTPLRKKEGEVEEEEEAVGGTMYILYTCMYVYCICGGLARFD